MNKRTGTWLALCLATLLTCSVAATEETTENALVQKEIATVVSDSENEDDLIAIDGALYRDDATEGTRTLVKFPEGTVVSGTFTIAEGTTHIAGKAFYEQKQLTAVIMPETLTSIGEQAFYNCGNLKTITVGDATTSVTNRAFSGCDKLTNVILRASATDLSAYIRNLSTIETFTVQDANDIGFYTVDGVLYHYGKKDNQYIRTLVKYPQAKDLNTAYTVQEGTNTIGSKAFYTMRELPEIILPKTVSKIEEQAFYNCEALTTITIGDNTSVTNLAFSGCNRLTTVIVRDSVTNIAEYIRNLNSLTTFHVTDTDGMGYYDVDGVLYHYDAVTKAHTLVKCPEAKTITGTYTVDAGTTQIGAYAMRNLSHMETVIFPATVTKIQNDAFNGCSTLTSVYFSGNVPTAIGNRAFSNGSAALILYYPAGNTSGWTSPTWVGPDKKTYNTATWIPEGTAVTPDPTIYNAALLQNLQKYFSGYSIALTTAADIDGDGQSTRRDAMILARYLAGWDNYASYFKP